MNVPVVQFRITRIFSHNFRFAQFIDVSDGLTVIFDISEHQQKCLKMLQNVRVINPLDLRTANGSKNISFHMEIPSLYLKIKIVLFT